MAKNRLIYQSDALFVSQTVNSTGAGQHAQLRRVQSANYSFNISRTDVNQFGQLARLEAIILESPTVSFGKPLLRQSDKRKNLSFQRKHGEYWMQQWLS